MMRSTRFRKTGLENIKKSRFGQRIARRILANDGPDLRDKPGIDNVRKTVCCRHIFCYIANVLQYRSHTYPSGKSALAALLIGLVLLLDAMAACPALHELIHHDADEPGHECAVTMFAHGKVESATVEVPVSIPTLLVEAAPRIEFCVFGAAIDNLPPGRAPPAVSSPQV